MKKIKKLFTLGLATILALSTQVSNVAFAESQQGLTNYNTAKEKISLGSYNKTASLYETDVYGEFRGPESFSLKSNGGLFLFDNLTNKVVSYSADGKIDNVIDVEDFKVARVASSKEDKLMLLNAANAKIYKDNNEEFKEYSIKNLQIETLSDFGVTNDDKPYVFLSDTDVGTTYIFELGNNVATISKKITGRLADDGKIYTSELIKENGLDVGHGCIITIHDNDSVIKIPIYSEHWVSGAKYLGIKDGYYLIQTFEFEDCENNTTVNENYIKAYDANGEMIYSIPIEENYKGIQNDIKLVNGSIKTINFKADSISLNTISQNSKKQAKLDSVNKCSDTSTMMDNTNNSVHTTRLASVTRSLIQTTVKSYWSCTWYCSASNYNGPSSYWTRPHYITSPNTTYQHIPYNWGGWDTYVGFLEKIENGKTAGNVYTDIDYGNANCAGVDCSGYVQRCWGLNDSKKNTTMLDDSSISQRISASQLKFGDAWNKTSHIMIYEKLDGYGNYVLYEATTTSNYDRVAHTTRSVSSVQSQYHSIRRLNITEDV